MCYEAFDLSHLRQFASNDRVISCLQIHGLHQSITSTFLVSLSNLKTSMTSSFFSQSFRYFFALLFLSSMWVLWLKLSYFHFRVTVFETKNPQCPCTQLIIERFLCRNVVCFQILSYFILEDFIFYWGHRILHTKWLYKHVHSVHHECVLSTLNSNSNFKASSCLVSYMCSNYSPALRYQSLPRRSGNGTYLMKALKSHVVIAYIYLSSTYFITHTSNLCIRMNWNFNNLCTWCRYATPFGLTSEYAHPAEILFLGFATVFGPAITGPHLLTLWIWMSLRVIETVEAHCGYDFPWSLSRYLPIYGGYVQSDVPLFP